MTTEQQTAALGRAIQQLEREAGKMHINARFARSEELALHAKFFAMKEDEAREDAAILADLMENLPNK